MRDLIFISLENWDDIWRRNQFLCTELAQRHPEARVLFVGLARLFFKELFRRGWQVFSIPTVSTVPGQPNILLTYCWQVFPNRFQIGRLCNELLARLWVRWVAKQHRFSRPVLWLNAHDAAHMAGRMEEAAVVYDVTDDWSKVSQPSERMHRTVREDARLCRAADAVIVCSETLREDKKKLSRNVHLVPNGVDASHYSEAHDKPSGKPLWRGNVYGYTGTLHGDRIDVELVRRLAGIIGHTGSIVLIGPDHLSVAEKKRLRLPNLFLVDAVPYKRLPDYMHRFDVCIVPHKVTPFTESLNPIKLWEYLALGKPIVATRVAGFRDFPQFVRLVDGAEEFAGEAVLAIHEPARVATARRAEAAQHSWKTRCDAIERILADCLIRRSRNQVHA